MGIAPTCCGWPGRCNAAGYNLLLTTYAGDNVARPAQDGIWHFGVTEWDEIEAAVQYALDQGAQTLVMGAVSLGGAVTDGFLAHSTLADQVDGVILDAPLSSLRDVIDEGAESRTIPGLGWAIPEAAGGRRDADRRPEVRRSTTTRSTTPTWPACSTCLC